jgi:glucose/arabinose dehydrogenase
MKNTVILACSSLLVICALAYCSSEKERERPAQNSSAKATGQEFADLSKREPNTPVVLPCEESQRQCHRVLDCSDREQKCAHRRIAFDVEACAKKYLRIMCENFQNRLPGISLVADSGNYISAPLAEKTVSAEFQARLHAPFDLEFLPDGTMLITEKRGNVVHIDAAGNKKNVIQLEVIDWGGAGLMGLAIDPGFAQNRFVYIAYSHKLDDSDPSFLNPELATMRRIVCRISRLTFNKGVLEDENVLIDYIPASYMHTGLGLEFGPDGKLYAGTGDAHNPLLSQDTFFLGGKILRLNTDGSIPEDNPDPASYVYSKGHRNVQGMAWNTETGDLYSSEHGADRFDEINFVEPGKNYGWGTYQCDERMSWKGPGGETTFPLVCFRHWNISPSGMEFVSDLRSPWHGSLFVASLRGKHLHRYVFEGGRMEVDEIFYIADDWNNSIPRYSFSRRIRDVEYRDGALYVISQNGLVKLTLASP